MKLKISTPYNIRPPVVEHNIVYRLDKRHPEVIGRIGFEGTLGMNINKIYGSKSVFAAKTLSGVSNFAIETIIPSRLDLAEASEQMRSTLYPACQAYYIYKIDIKNIRYTDIAKTLGYDRLLMWEQPNIYAMKSTSILIDTILDCMQNNSSDRPIGNLMGLSLDKAYDYYCGSARYTKEVILEGPIPPEKITHLYTISPLSY
jgi:hypothetical protein